MSREAGGRNVAIKANLLGRDQGSFVAEAMKKVNARVKLPPGYYMTWGGQFENQQRAIARLKVIVPLSIFSIFVLLFWVFGSMRRAILVLLMVPFTLIGGLAGLGIAGLHLSVSAAVGFIAVAGISVQNGVIMVEQMVDLMRNGVRFSEAVLEGAVSRLRPILMTAVSTILALLPLAAGPSEGSIIAAELGTVVIGGLLSSTLLTLLVVPVVYSLVDGLKESLSGTRKGRARARA